MPQAHRARRRLAGTAWATVLTLGLAVLLAGCSWSTSSGGDAGVVTPSAAAAVPTAAGSSAKGYTVPTLRWSDCGSGFQCATLTLPLDRTHPDGATVDIAVDRLPAAGPDRIGSLVLNPGGPGGSGYDYARAARVIIPAAVRQRFDVVGFDPRGTGRSTPVECLTPAQTAAFLALDPAPDNPAETARIATVEKGFAAACEAADAALLPHLASTDIAADMDDLRAALGDEKLTYLGKSYGTFLGATYAQLFPTHVRAMILDGVVDPRLTAEQLDAVQAQGFETALDAFLDWCAARRSGCGLGTGDAASLQARLDQLQATSDTSGLPGGHGRVVDEGLFSYAIATGLYSRSSGWPTLDAALRQAAKGDGAGLLGLADAYADRGADGSYGHATEAAPATNCLDRPPYAGGEAGYDAARQALARTAPHFGPLNVVISQVCQYWPALPTDKPGPVTAAGAPPILLVGTTRDPATPVSWAKSLDRQLASSALVVYDGDGHTVYGDGASPCVDRLGDAYLIDLTVPADGTRC